jgi:hypothetical protein
MTLVHQPQVAMAHAIAHPIVQNWEELLQEHVHRDLAFVVYLQKRVARVQVRIVPIFKIRDTHPPMTMLDHASLRSTNAPQMFVN